MPEPDQLYFEDLAAGFQAEAGPYTVTREDVIDFGSRWDPLPIHIDEAAATRSPFGGLTAAGIHTLAIKQRLMHQVPIMEAVLCTMGFDEVRFPAPLRAGREVRLRVESVESRPSSSKPDRGIVKLLVTLVDDTGATVLRYFDTILIRKRDAARG